MGRIEEIRANLRRPAMAYYAYPELEQLVQEWAKDHTSDTDVDSRVAYLEGLRAGLELSVSALRDDRTGGDHEDSYKTLRALIADNSPPGDSL